MPWHTHLEETEEKAVFPSVDPQPMFADGRTTQGTEQVFPDVRRLRWLLMQKAVSELDLAACQKRTKPMTLG